MPTSSESLAVALHHLHSAFTHTNMSCLAMHEQAGLKSRLLCLLDKVNARIRKARISG